MAHHAMFLSCNLALLTFEQVEYDTVAYSRYFFKVLLYNSLLQSLYHGVLGKGQWLLHLVKL